MPSITDEKVMQNESNSSEDTENIKNSEDIVEEQNVKADVSGNDFQMEDFENYTLMLNEKHENDSIIEIENKITKLKISEQKEDDKKTDPINVYMELLVNLLSDIHSSVKVLDDKKFTEKYFLQELLSMVEKNEIEKIKMLLNLETKGIDKKTNISITNFVTDIKNISNDLKKEFILLKTAFSVLNSETIDLCSENRTLNDKLQVLKNESDEEKTKNISKNNQLKENLISLLSKYGELDSLLEVDLLSKCKEIIDENKLNVENLKNYVATLKEKVTKQEAFIKENDIEIIQQENYNLIQTQKKLQDENLEMTKYLQKLTQKNMKYKENLLLFSNELDKYVRRDQYQTETIRKQKTLIELFQRKFNEKKTIDDPKKLADQLNFQ